MLQKFHAKLLAIVLGATSTLITPTLGMAQEVALEEVVVTAQRREGKLQDVPIAMSAFTANDIDKMGASNLEQIARITPNLFFNQSDSIKSSRTSIRGISPVGNTAGADPSVGYYLDEVYLGAAVGSFLDLYDVERIEVLRGPQGTLFGRNTIGGVISVTSRKPSNEFTAFADASFGNYSLRRFKAGLSGPIVDGKLAASLSAVSTKRDGYLYNEFLKSDTNNIDESGARLSLLFTPSEAAEFLLSLDTRNVDQTAQSQETLVNNPMSTVGQLGLLVNTNPTDRKVFSGFLGRETLKNAWGASLRARFKTSHFDVVSVSGYRTHDYYVEGESDQVPFGIGRNFDPESVDRFTQEIRLESTDAGKLQWMVGAYYYDQKSVNDGGILIENDLLRLFGAGSLGTLTGGSRGEIKATSTAAFASFDYAMSDKLSLTVGGRFTKEKKDFTWVQRDLEAIFGSPILGGTGSAAGSADWSNFTPALTARFRQSNDVMFYGSISKGFKGGGFNDGSGIPRQQSQAYNPETLMNYEVGMKSTFRDRRVRFNAAAFAMRWKDIQVRADDPSTPNSFDPRVTNAGRAHSNGLELELSALLSPKFLLEANAAYLDSGYDEGVIPVSSGSPVLLDKFARAPKTSFGLSAEYTFSVNDKADLVFRGDYQRQAEVVFNLDPRDVNAREPGYGLLNARVTLRSKSEKWRVAIWGANLADETYRVGAFDLLNNTLVGQYFSILGAPRTFGIDAHIEL